MLEIAVRDRTDAVRVRVSEGELLDMVRDMGEWPDSVLVLQRVPDLPHTYAQACPEYGAWTVEYRAGSPARHYGTQVGDVEQVAALLLGWAREDEGWGVGVAWERIEFEVPEPAPLELSAQDEATVVDEVRRLLVAGYATRAQATEVAEECLVDKDSRPVTKEQAKQLVDRMWLERVAEQRSWVGETDPERVAKAFAALEATGITARENFTCCRNCGNGEIWAENPEARGFVYFHSQCTEGVASGGDLWLLYGGFDDSADTTAAVGREVVAALEECGLGVSWDGSPDDAIRVTGLDWRRRLVG
ncbi:DUF6891 domain-containing protein [Kitasatospora sp. NPDC048407]|uniref:DUF6891 domain-containing protein n=1 Tax=Kitasatospora sp. NPDC048407 TaxID=3364051 RepID=UPI003720F18D